MANLSSHLFTVINDEPTITTVLINLPSYKKMYMQDKTPDKSDYTKKLVFIWYYHDANSPYFNSENLMEECMVQIT